MSRIIFELGVLDINIDMPTKSGQAISVFAFNISRIVLHVVSIPQAKRFVNNFFLRLK